MSTTEARGCPTARPRARLASVRAPTSGGFSLIELVAFIAILGAGLAGVLIAFRAAAMDSADPVVRKQALAIAESMLEEVQQMAFTYCDPDDSVVTTANSASDCTMGINASGPDAGETRYSTTTPFDQVKDYNGFATAGAGIADITGTAIGGLGNYDVAVSVQPQAWSGIPSTEALQITVTVTGPRNVTVRLDGYRTRYAPNL